MAPGLSNYIFWGFIQFLDKIMVSISFAGYIFCKDYGINGTGIEYFVQVVGSFPLPLSLPSSIHKSLSSFLVIFERTFTAKRVVLPR